MQRRTFLKKSAVGIGALAGIYGGILKAEEASGERHSVEAAQSNGNDLVEEEDRAAWGTNAVILKSPWSGPPSVDDMLRDSEHTLALHRFYRVGVRIVRQHPLSAALL